jgi:hypothetical protein
VDTLSPRQRGAIQGDSRPRGLILEMSDLIRSLGADLGPVRRLYAPMTRTALWLSASVPYVVAVAVGYRMAGEAVSSSLDARFLIEELAMIATAITAAAAALCCVVPGRDRRIVVLSLVPLAAWLTAVVVACLDAWLRSGSFPMGWPPDWTYFPMLALSSLVPAVAMVVMLRRGAPLYPRSTLALGALAVLALGNAGLRIFHAGEATLTDLVCDFGTLALLLALAGWIGRGILAWPRLGVGREVIV